MGMGEPLLNYANVLAGIEKITSPDGLGMSPQRITLSTAGIAKMIKNPSFSLNAYFMVPYELFCEWAMLSV